MKENIEIVYESGLSFDDVLKKIPRLTKENKVYHDHAIISFTVKHHERIVGELFYDEESNYYCYDPKFNMELNRTVGDTLRDHYNTQTKEIEPLLPLIKTKVKENTKIELYKPFLEREYFFNFAEKDISDGLDKYVKVIAYNNQEAIKIMHQTVYKDGYFNSFSRYEYEEKYSLNQEHCIDIFAQNPKDFLLTKNNEEGYDEKILLHKNELYDFAYKLFVEKAEEGSKIREISRVNLENGGEKEALNMLSDYADYTITKSNKVWNEVYHKEVFDIEELDRKEIQSMKEDELLFILDDLNYQVLHDGENFKVKGQNREFETIRELFICLNDEAQSYLEQIKHKIREDRV
jgi:hypothetical protein